MCLCCLMKVLEIHKRNTLPLELARRKRLEREGVGLLDILVVTQISVNDNLSKEDFSKTNKKLASTKIESSSVTIKGKFSRPDWF
jgi:hypothetical protein